MYKCTWILVAALALVGSASAQFDLNGPNAALTINGTAPSANALHDVSVSVPGTVAMTFSSGANMDAGIILLGSSIDPAAGPVSPTPWGGSIDAGTPAFTGLSLLANGVTPSTLLDNLFNTGATRTMTASFSAAACAFINSRFAVQAIIRDVANPPFFLDNTEVGDINFGTAALVNTLMADDSLLTIDISCTPCTFYGVAYSTMRVSTNGWIKFGGSGTSNDLSESAVEMINGTPGGGLAGPMIAVLWEDLDVGNGVAGQMLVVDRSTPGIIFVTWQNADYFPATPFGTVSCTIDCATGNVILDYTGYTLAAPPTEGLVGVSAANAAATVTAHDLATAGSVNPLFSPAGSVQTIFQSFDGLGAPAIAAQPMDLGGLVLNFLNTTGSDYSLF